MFLPCGHDIDTSGVDTAVSQNICQLSDVLIDSVKCPGEEFSQIVRKHLAFLDTGGFTQLLHLPPDAAAVEGLAVFTNKDCTSCNPPAFRII